MASFTLSEWALYSGGSWGNWNGSFSGDTYISDETGRYILYKVYLDLGSYVALNRFTFTTAIRGSSNNPNTELTVQLLNANPMNSYYDVLAEETVSATSYMSGTEYSYTFTGLSLDSSRNYFLLITDNNTHPVFQDYIMHGYSSISGTGYTESRPLSLTLDSARVTTGGSNWATVGNGAGQSITVYVKYGNTQLYSGTLDANGRCQIPVQKSWFTLIGNTASQSFSVGVTVSADQTLYASFEVVAGSDMLPTVTNVTTEIVQPSGSKAATNYPNTYIAGISMCKVTAQVTSGSNATFGTGAVTITETSGAWVEMSYNSSTGKYEGTTPTLTRATNRFTVSATDSRGLAGSAVSGDISVVQYTAPVITVNTDYTYRCDASGNPESGGAYWRAMATVSYYGDDASETGLPGNRLTTRLIIVNGQTAGPVVFESGVQTGVEGGGLDPTTNYTMVFRVEDRVSGLVYRNHLLQSVTRNVVFRRNSTGTTVGIGTTPTRTAGSSVELAAEGEYLVAGNNIMNFLPAYKLGVQKSGVAWDVKDISFTSPTDMRNRTEFITIPASNRGNISNLPPIAAGVEVILCRQVIVSNTRAMIALFEIAPTAGRIWISYGTYVIGTGTASWTAWYSLTAT